ncbi:MAG: bifunctional 5,10-methylenetetrahydrofolate dehydrogenase/5,10-methenyltetrahydrofolate cyclohydrolase [Patescibacteria group bacterium]|nr:bifunctional 5,10-methylenetetrahydrofolate dehydrogenase/5,10-methenyltetrahydrofolate cyclohydrolase [Patescibacteria group bacterium]
MEINGKEIAQKILESIKKRVDELKNKEIFPTLAIILIGDDPASKVYVNQKIKKADEVGIKTILINIASNSDATSELKLVEIIKKLNKDKSVDGIIVQRPLPKNIDQELITNAVSPEKDVDGLRRDSKFEMPLGLAVLEILKQIHGSTPGVDAQKFRNWIKSKKITVIGKGITGGGPVINILKKLNIEPTLIDSKTHNSRLATKNSDVIVSAVGKPNIINSESIKKDTILISIGIHKGSDGKLHGDYNENEIKNIASFYTPTPGGVGPVNVAMLLKNVALSV